MLNEDTDGQTQKMVLYLAEVVTGGFLMDSEILHFSFSESCFLL